MRGSSLPWGRGVAALLVPAFALALAAPPCSAAEPQHREPAPPTAKRSLSESAAAQVAATAPPRAFAQDPSAGAASGESRSFFRTPTGVAAIVLMAVGGGYALYSVSHDQKPVKSPIR